MAKNHKRISEKILRKEKFSIVILFTVDENGVVDHSAAFRDRGQESLVKGLYSGLYNRFLELFQHGQTMH